MSISAMPRIFSAIALNLLLLHLPLSAAAAPGDVKWERVYSSLPGEDGDHANGLAIDEGGNILVTGYASHKDGDYDFLTLKYGPDGALLWARLYGKTWNDFGRAVAAGPDGDVIVAGMSDNTDNPSKSYMRSYFSDYLVLRYSRAGELLMETTAFGNLKNNEPWALTVTKRGNIYVAGSARNSPDVYDGYYTVKFGSDGERTWERFEDWGSESVATGIQRDNGGNPVVTGYTFDFVNNNYSIKTIRYGIDGKGPLTLTNFNKNTDDEKAHAVAVDPEGNIIIAGETSGEGGTTLTLKYSPKDELLWAQYYYGSDYKNSANAVAVDSYGRIYVAGKTFKEDQEGDFLLVVYSKDGALIDHKVYPYGGDSGVAGVAVDKDGSILLTGTTKDGEEPAVVRVIKLEGYPAPAGAEPARPEAPAAAPAVVTTNEAPEVLSGDLFNFLSPLVLPYYLDVDWDFFTN